MYKRQTEHWALPLSITDRGGRTHTYRYDERGNLLCEQDPLGHTTHYGYDPQGRVERITDALGKHKTLDWNTHSQLLSYRDCSNTETHYLNGSAIKGVQQLSNSYCI